MKPKPTVTIGIPAYNEEANIAYLLRSLLAQKRDTFELKEIVVISDGSTDQTDTEVSSVRSSKIKLIRQTKRVGLNALQNWLVKHTSSDILAIVNADVIIKGEKFLDNLIAPLLSDRKIGLTGSRFLSLRMRQSIGRILGNSMEMKRYIYTHLLRPNNVYLCHGSARAFSRGLYKQISWPGDVPEDAYSYFFALQCGFKFSCSPKAEVYLQPSTNLRDHIRQSTRFVRGVSKLKNYFDPKYIDRAYEITPKQMLKATFIYTLKKPLSIPVYLGLMLFVRFINRINDSDQSKFNISESSKKWAVDTLLYNGITYENNVFERKI